MAGRLKIKGSTIDEYLAAVSDDQRPALAALRKTIRAAAPKAEECISYGLAMFRQHGMLVAFGASTRHCALYLLNDTTVKHFRNELKDFDTSPGTIRFQPDKPLPASLVRKLVKMRVAENKFNRRAKKSAALTKRSNLKARTLIASSSSVHGLPSKAEVESVIASLKRLGSKRVRQDMGPRYGITGPGAEKSFGVPVGKIQQLGKQLKKGRAPGANHELAAALWDTGWYEARMLASFLDEPALVTGAQMDRWARDFDNWAIVDTVCFKLFDRVPPELAFKKMEKWAKNKDEFIKRAAFALLGCVALHNKDVDDESLLRRLPLAQRAAADDRNFVKKGVSWALRAIGRRSARLNTATVELAGRLARRRLRELAAQRDGSARTSCAISRARK